jgi:hypothetical protein
VVGLRRYLSSEARRYLSEIGRIGGRRTWDRLRADPLRMRERARAMVQARERRRRELQRQHDDGLGSELAR